MTRTPCTKCKHCTDVDDDENGDRWLYCDFDETWMSEEWAAEGECDMFEQKLDDNETKEP